MKKRQKTYVSVPSTGKAGRVRALTEAQDLVSLLYKTGKVKECFIGDPVASFDSEMETEETLVPIEYRLKRGVRSFDVPEYHPQREISKIENEPLWAHGLMKEISSFFTDRGYLLTSGILDDASYETACTYESGFRYLADSHCLKREKPLDSYGIKDLFAIEISREIERERGKVEYAGLGTFATGGAMIAASGALLTVNPIVPIGMGLVGFSMMSYGLYKKMVKTSRFKRRDARWIEDEVRGHLETWEQDYLGALASAEERITCLQRYCERVENATSFSSNYQYEKDAIMRDIHMDASLHNKRLESVKNSFPSIRSELEEQLTDIKKALPESTQKLLPGA